MKRGDKNCADWKRSQKRTLFVAILFNLYNEYLTNEALTGFKTEGQVIYTLKYNDILALLAKVETVLQGTINRLIKIVSCCGMKMNLTKIKIMRISRKPPPVQNITDQKALENMEYFNYLGNMITNN